LIYFILFLDIGAVEGKSVIPLDRRPGFIILLIPTSQGWPWRAIKGFLELLNTKIQYAM